MMPDDSVNDINSEEVNSELSDTADDMVPLTNQHPVKDRRLSSVICMGIAFLLLFTAFDTGGIIMQTVIRSIQAENPAFKGDGYTSLAIIYIVFAVFNWMAPSCLTFLGPRLSMMVGGITYALFISAFMWPQTWLLYMTSVLMGMGAPLIWTGQGNYLTLMSDTVTMSRNSGIFWTLLQGSMLFGNLFVFFQFQGQEVISRDTRMVVFGALTVVSIIGIVSMFLLPKPGATEGVGRSDVHSGALEALKKSMALFCTRKMMLLSVVLFYLGIELSFYSGVYSSSIGSTLLFADSKRLVALSGIFIGLGEILGGATFGIFSRKTNRYGRDPIVVFGYLVHMLSFLLIFLNLPSDASLGDTNATSYWFDGQPSGFIAIFCSFLLGFGDACFNTQMYSILGVVYPEDSGPAFALFKFTQSLSAAACFFYSSVLGLHWHLLILVLLATAGTLCFCRVEWKAGG